MEWAEKQGVRLEYIQPGKPQQNGSGPWQLLAGMAAAQ
jgi:hypothetical protein